jgi:tRNA (guanine-N7-)-methyltransferase
VTEDLANRTCKNGTPSRIFPVEASDQEATFFPVIEQLAELQARGLDLVRLFGRSAPLQVDLGCGDGSFLCDLARQSPDKNFLGIERLTKRVEKVRRKAEMIENLRVLGMDSLFAVRYLLPENSVETFYLLFPDPWPKRRHQQRRIFTDDFLDAIATALQQKGVFHIATDQLDYFCHIERVSRAHSRFQAVGFDDAVLPSTKFERRFREQGVLIYRLTLRKTSPVK